jgi:SAM-dependent methyltransferase
MRLDDQSFVRGQYGSTDHLRTRMAVWQPDPELGAPQDLVVSELSRRSPERVLEVGCGTGALALRIGREVGCSVAAVDSSQAMVGAARNAGVDAEEGTVEHLRFADGSFDAAVAAWMLYHVDDLDQGVAELARVLMTGGCLIAVTNGELALAEVYEAVGGRPLVSQFSSENGESVLARHFAGVRRIDFRPRAVFHDQATLGGYLHSLGRGELADRVGGLTFPFVAHGAVTVFVAERH